MMKKTPFFLFVICVLLVSTVVLGQVSLSVSKKAASKTKIAVADFDGVGTAQTTANECEAVLKNDLQLSGHFSVASLGQTGSGFSELNQMKNQGFDYFVQSRVMGTSGALKLSVKVFDLSGNSILLNETFQGETRDKIALVHRASDAIIEAITGLPGLGNSQIAFVSNQSGNKQIYTVGWDGRNLVQLTNGKDIAIYPKWSPVARQILCTDYASRLPHIYLLDLARGSKRPLSNRPGLNAFARFSPDGKKIVLTLSRDGNPEIYTCMADGSQLRRLTKTKSVESSPCWTRDGKKIVFVSDRSGSPQIYWMNADGTGVKRLTYRGRYNTSPEVSPNGQLIAYSSKVGGTFQIFVIDPQTKESVQVTRNRAQNEDPTWGPDNRHLAYTSTKNYQSDIYLIDIYDGHPIRLTKGLKDCTSPSWSPSY